MRPCTHCRPDTQLDIPDLPRGATPASHHRPPPQGHQHDEHSPAPSPHRRP
nr:hypothetical protein [Streptomyces sp. SLBN-115]